MPGAAGGQGLAHNQVQLGAGARHNAMAGTLDDSWSALRTGAGKQAGVGGWRRRRWGEFCFEAVLPVGCRQRNALFSAAPGTCWFPEKEFPHVPMLFPPAKHLFPAPCERLRLLHPSHPPVTPSQEWRCWLPDINSQEDNGCHCQCTEPTCAPLPGMEMLAPVSSSTRRLVAPWRPISTGNSCSEGRGLHVHVCQAA